MKRKRRQEITDKEREAREYNNKIFGENGMLFQKKKELIKPVSDQVYKAMERVAKQKRLDFLFDKSSDFVVVYANPTHDYTDYVMDELGLTADNKNTKNTPASVSTPSETTPAPEKKGAVIKPTKTKQ